MYIANLKNVIIKSGEFRNVPVYTIRGFRKYHAAL